VYSFVTLLPAVIGRLCGLNISADIGNGLALSNQLLSGFVLADDLLPRAADFFMVKSSAQSGRM